MARPTGFSCSVARLASEDTQVALLELPRPVDFNNFVVVLAHHVGGAEALRDVVSGHIHPQPGAVPIAVDYHVAGPVAQLHAIRTSLLDISDQLCPALRANLLARLQCA